MPFAIGLLVLLGAACAFSSLVTQGLDYSAYARQYGERWAAVIVALHLDDAYHSGWFVAITAFLCLHLLGCNLVRLPALVKRFRRLKDPAAAMAQAPTAAEQGVDRPRDVFAALRMPAPAEIPGTQPALFAVKNRLGVWGAWVCHLGILLMIVGFALGQMTHRQLAVYGVPGQTRALGDTGLQVTINDFTVALRTDDTVEQYIADIQVTDAAGAVQAAQVSVNHPATLHGWTVYQNSTGYAARVRVLKDGVPLQEQVLCVGETLSVADKPDLVVSFQAFYPDYVLTPGAGPSTASSALNNPAYLYLAAYQGQVLGMNALLEGEQLTIDEYTVLFDQPQPYTLLVAKQDRFIPLALAGGLITLLGLLLAFYLRPVTLWAWTDGQTWTAAGRCEKGGVLFAEQLREAAEAARGKDQQATGQA